MLSHIELLLQLKSIVFYAKHYMHSIHIFLTRLFYQNFESKFCTKLLDQNFGLDFGLDFWTRILDQTRLGQTRLSYNILIHFPKCNIGLQNSLLTDRQTDIVLCRAAITAKNIGNYSIISQEILHENNVLLQLPAGSENSRNALLELQ